MSRQEDFKKAADDYVNGEPDGAQKIVGQVGFEFGAEYGYQYAINKAFDILSQMLYTKRDDEHLTQHYTRSVESMGEFVSQTDFLNQFKQKMQ